MLRQILPITHIPNNCLCIANKRAGRGTSSAISHITYDFLFDRETKWASKPGYRVPSMYANTHALIPLTPFVYYIALMIIPYIM